MLSEKAQTLHEAVNVAQFIALVKKHNEIDTLTPAIVNEFIERINVHAPDKSSGHLTQQSTLCMTSLVCSPRPRPRKKRRNLSTTPLLLDKNTFVNASWNSSTL